MRSSAVVPFAVLGLAITAVACSKTPAANPTPVAPMPTYYPQPQPTYLQPPPGTPPGPTGMYTAPAPTATQPPPPPAGGGTQATPVTGAAPQAASAALAALAISQLPPGMQPEGAAFAGQFTQGQTLEQPLSLMPGKCYSIAAAGVGITAIHIDLLGVPIAVPLVSSQKDGVVSLIGSGTSGCWKYPFPIPGTARIVVKAVQGAGIAAAQVYVK